MRNILMGVAAIALAATGANAEPGKGNGGGNGGGNGKNNGAAANGPGKQAGEKRGGDNRGGGAMKVAQNGNSNGNGGNGNRAETKAKGNDHGDWKPAKADAPKGQGANGQAKAWNANDRGNDRDKVGRDYVDGRDGKGKSGKWQAYDRDRDGIRFGYRDDDARNYGLINGCPPGLAKKNNGCNPPGLAKAQYRDYDRSDWWRLPGLSDGRYRYYDNNLVRLSPTGSILGYYPLLGGALAAGNVWPNWFDHQPVPAYYESYYGLGPSGSYRYADNVLYRVDPDTAAISSIAALLTGDTFAVGQRMPLGYDVYNVPYEYRDRYADGPDAYYRYSDGYVYQVDPTTQLIAAAIQLLT